MNKAYQTSVKNGQTQYFNGAGGGTPLCADNLNAIHNGLNAVDDRVIVLDAELAKHKGAITSATFNSTTGVLVFKDENNVTLLTVDLNVEKIPVSFSMSPTGVITMTTSDGTTFTADVGSLIKTYTFSDSTDINFTDTIDSSGNHIITAIIENGSIDLAKLDPAVKQIFDDLVDIATTAATNATNAATLSKSYAVGDTGGTRTDEDIDNAKYYKEQAEELAQYAKDASVVGNFELDANGNLVYEDNSVHKFEVQADGNLYYEVI